MHIGLNVKYRYSCQILIKLEFSRKIFEKHSNVKFHEYPSSRSRDVPCRRADIYDEVNSLSSKLWECA